MDASISHLMPRLTSILVALLVVAGCSPSGSDPIGDPHDVFFGELSKLCGSAYEGSLLEGNESDAAFAQQRLVMHVRECAVDEVRIPFHVGDDRSRTWVVTRIGNALRLKHDHRHEDGSEDEVTWYGGDGSAEGTGSLQEFHADDWTAELLPAAATNVWTLELHPGEAFVYRLRREGTDRRFAVRFDLARPVEPPPAPWGSADE